MSIRIPRTRWSTDRKRCCCRSWGRSSTTSRLCVKPIFVGRRAPRPRRRPNDAMESLTGTAELEIKLRLPRKAVANVLRHPALTELKAGRARRRRLVSTYFDTPNLRLATAGVGLRIRRDGRQWIQTVKGPPEGESGGGLAARPEYEWPIGRYSKMPSIDTARLATTPWRRVLLKAARRGLAPAFVTDFNP